jgi:hypothetical protein
LGFDIFLVYLHPFSIHVRDTSNPIPAHTLHFNLINALMLASLVPRILGRILGRILELILSVHGRNWQGDLLRVDIHGIVIG